MTAAPPRIAWFSPLPPARSGIADYTRELLPCLAEAARIDLYCEQPAGVDPAVRAGFPVLPLGDYPARRWDYDAAVYQIGNSMHHDAIYRTFLRYPALVDLHEYNLHHFIAHRTAGQGDSAAFVREMTYAMGPAGLRLAREIRLGRREHPFEAPLNDRLLTLALGLVVHGESVRRRAAAANPALPIAVVPLPVGTQPAGSPRRPADWPPDALVFASAGQVTAAKAVSQALTAFARLRKTVPGARYLVIGEAQGAETDLAQTVQVLGIDGLVKFTGFVDDLGEFAAWLAGADVVINLRTRTLGEASSTALRALAVGRPLIVSDHGWYAELPDDVCIRVPPGDEEALLAAMFRFAGDADLRAAFGRQGATYALARHAPDAAARAYMEFLFAVTRPRQRSKEEHSYGR